MSAPLLADAAAVEAKPARRAAWRAALGAVILLAYFLWAGSSYDPRCAALWTYTKALRPGPGVSDWALRWSGGWMVPAPGLGHLFVAAAMVFAALSVLAFRALTRASAEPPVTRSKYATLWQVVIAVAMFAVALDMQLIVLRNWTPLPLDPSAATARYFHPAVVGRGSAIAATLVAVGLLLAALAVQGRSLWLAAVFAFHPVVIMESASNGWRFAWVLPLLVLVALGWRLHRWLRELLIMGAAAGCTWWVAHLVLGGKAFNGLLAECLNLASVEGRQQAAVLVAIEVALQAAVVFLAFRKGWSLARTLGHIWVAWALVSPQVMPADLLPMLALLPLAWNRAGWVLSGTILWTYAVIPLGVAAAHWHVPTWLIFLTIGPAVVVELEELATA